LCEYKEHIRIPLQGGAISWKSSLQRIVSLSTEEAEHITLDIASQESMYFEQPLTELQLRKGKDSNTVQIYEHVFEHDV